MSLLIYLDDCKIKLDKKIQEYSNTIVSGRLQTMEDYRSICGRIEGLNEAKEILILVIQGYQKSDHLPELSYLDN